MLGTQPSGALGTIIAGPITAVLSGTTTSYAPDYPAFGHSAVPSRAEFHYTHAHLSQVMEAVLVKLGITRFAMYVMDFGGPIGSA